ncbi:MAG TPA: hypothetical protein VHO29_07180 [Marmoricola sp.]|nr:hypothetical protein [Marmoricola sp.]
MIPRPAAVILAVLLGSTVAGCGAGSTPGGAEPHSGRSAAVDTKTPAPPAATTSVRLGAETRLGLDGRPGPAALDGTTLAYPLGRDGRAWDRVVTVSLATGQSREVARTGFPGGFVNWVAVAGSWVVYVDQSAKQSDADPEVLWRVVAVDPGSGHRLVLSSNADRPDPYVPIVQSGGGYVFWTQAEADRTARELLWKPGLAKPRDVLRHTEMTPGSASVSRDGLVYLGAAATGARGHTVGGDCWRVPLTGGTPEPLTHTALAMDCVAGGDTVAWTLHIDPEVTPQPDDGILDDPYELWARTGDGEPRLLRRGYFPLTHPGVGGGYVAWQTYAQRLTVQSAANPAARSLAPGKPVEQVLADGDNFVYITRDGSGDMAHVLAVPSVG